MCVHDRPFAHKFWCSLQNRTTRQAIVEARLASASIMDIPAVAHYWTGAAGLLRCYMGRATSRTTGRATSRITACATSTRWTTGRAARLAAGPRYKSSYASGCWTSHPSGSGRRAEAAFHMPSIPRKKIKLDFDVLTWRISGEYQRNPRSPDNITARMNLTLRLPAGAGLAA
jgi:hypothetical protein